MQLGGDPHGEQPPTIHVRARKSPALALLVGGLLLVGIGWECHWQQRLPPWLAYCLMGVGGSLLLVALRWLFDRRPRVVISHQGIEVVAWRAGIVRWAEIVHVECFSLPEQGGVALFVTPEALARVPANAARHGTPVLVNNAFAGPPIWFGDAMLEASATEVTAELIARRSGSVGPLTKRIGRK
jgi:hypothetical protein